MIRWLDLNILIDIFQWVLYVLLFAKYQLYHSQLAFISYLIFSNSFIFFLLTTIHTIFILLFILKVLILNMTFIFTFSLVLLYCWSVNSLLSMAFFLSPPHPVSSLFCFKSLNSNTIHHILISNVFFIYYVRLP